jgi:hypothetical protein
MDVDGMTGGGKGPPGPSTTAVAPAAGGAPHVRKVQTQSDSEQLRILSVILFRTSQCDVTWTGTY